MPSLPETRQGEGLEPMKVTEVQKMKNKAIKNKESGQQSVKCRPVPDFLDCPNCGFATELWSGEIETKCIICGHRFYRKELIVH